MSVVWPAFIKYSGDDELAYIAGENEWLGDEDLSAGRYETSDRLIDSVGRVYSLVAREQQRITPEVIDEPMTAEQLAALLQKHFSVTGACCVSKMHLDSASECMEMLARDQAT